MFLLGAAVVAPIRKTTTTMESSLWIRHRRTRASSSRLTKAHQRVMFRLSLNSTMRRPTTATGRDVSEIIRQRQDRALLNELIVCVIRYTAQSCNLYTIRVIE